VAVAGVAVVGALISIPGVKQLLQQLATGQVSGALKTAGTMATPYVLARLAGAGPAAVATFAVGTVLTYHDPEHHDVITEHANAIGESLDPGMWLFGVRTPIGGFFASSWAATESTLRSGWTVVKSTREGAADIARGVGAFIEGASEGRRLFWK
jgi:hypothetical protein